MATQFEKRMAKKNNKEDVVPEVVTEELVIEPVYDRVAYDFFKDDTGKYLRVTVEFCLTTGAARVTEVKGVADSLPRAVQAAQKLFTHKLMGIKGE